MKKKIFFAVYAVWRCHVKNVLGVQKDIRLDWAQ